ncbi:MAG: trehalose-phosphatase [Burkholderiales bacterium]|nr:trehalose-phosphatase [Burkholderiales bacterium]
MSPETPSSNGTPRPARFVRPPPPALGADCALFLDIDGTLAEFARVPDAVHIDTEITDALRRLFDDLGGALALITGRAITSADRLFPNLKLPIAGQHGCERRDADGGIHLHSPVKTTQARLRNLLRGLATRHPQLLFEDKGASLALHYRETPQLAAHVHRTLRESLGADEGYELQPGKMLLEVRPEGRDKGTAISDFMAEPPFAGRLPVFVGDDLTDEHGFTAVERLDGWTVKVGPGPTAARFRLADPTAVKHWLQVPMVAEATYAMDPEDEG